jgi:hypothetical protein
VFEPHRPAIWGISPTALRDRSDKSQPQTNDDWLLQWLLEPITVLRARFYKPR